MNVRQIAVVMQYNKNTQKLQEQAIKRAWIALPKPRPA